MIVSEKEASKKACVRTYILENRDFEVCIASKCMSWRWIVKDAKLGYCGLAGEPRELRVQ